MDIQFKARPGDVDLWHAIFQDLVDTGGAGAALQDRMESFGAEVDAALEELIETYGVEDAFSVEHYDEEAGLFSVSVYSPTPDHGQALMGVLSHCPVEALRRAAAAE